MPDRRSRRAAALKSAPSRGTVIAVLIALGVHIGVISWITIQPRDMTKAPPNVTGFAGATELAAVGGLPMTTQRVLHRFSVRDDPEGHPIPRARVRSVLDAQEATTDDHGIALLSVRPVAKLLVQVERPGFAMHAAQLENSHVGAERRHTILLKRADVPYSIIDTIFMMRCNHCHGNESASGGVNLSTYERAVRSRFGARPIIRPGKPDSSLLIHALNDTVANPGALKAHVKAVGRFPEFEIETLAEWIREGAKKVVP